MGDGNAIYSANHIFERWQRDNLESILSNTERHKAWQEIFLASIKVLTSVGFFSHLKNNFWSVLLFPSVAFHAASVRFRLMRVEMISLFLPHSLIEQTAAEFSPFLSFRPPTDGARALWIDALTQVWTDLEKFKAVKVFDIVKIYLLFS